MKKTRFRFALFIFSALLYSCGGEGGTTAENEGVAATETRPAVSTADHATLVQEGKTLVEGSDCRACHANDQRLVGPSYQEVAERYQNEEGAVEMLAGKIIEGGAGNWGEIAMAAHPQISREDAAKMVHYVLSLHNGGGAPQAN
jgi:cytochrome c